MATLLRIAEYSDKARSAGILPAREKCRQDGGATKDGCHCILQSSIGGPWRKPKDALRSAEVRGMLAHRLRTESKDYA